MFFFFLFGRMEIRAEDCLTGIGHRDLELVGYAWTEVERLEALGPASGLGSSTPWAMVRCGNNFCIMLDDEDCTLGWFVLWPCSGPDE